jgi:hypothetical protein
MFTKWSLSIRSPIKNLYSVLLSPICTTHPFQVADEATASRYGG